MIELEVNGTPYTEFMSASVTLAVDTMANDFTFAASAVNGFPPFKDGDSVKCIVDSAQVLDGFIDGVDGTEAEGSHVVTYSGRDKTQDFIDSDIEVMNEIRATGNLTLKRLIELVIAHLGQDIKVVDEFNPPEFNAAEDIASPKVGQNALEFVSFYAMKRQAILSSDSDGNILITQSSPIESGEILKSDASGDNNIIGQSFSVKSKNRFNKYFNKGQLDPLALNLTPSPDIAGVEGQSGGVTDSSVRTGRQKVSVEGKGYSSAQLSDRSKWSKQIAKARATKFNCTTLGHSKQKTSGIWRENELTLIISLAANITRYMLSNSVTFSQAEGSAETTSFEFVEKDVYTIDSKIQSQKNVGSQLDAFSL